MSNQADCWVIVTDYHRGVAFGRLIESDDVMQIAVLADARLCWHWPGKNDPDNEATPFGLAHAGPPPGSKISAPVERCKIYEVAKILDCTEKAVARFAEAGWAR